MVAMVALMLDEVMGTLAAEVFGRYNIVTTRLDVGFKRRLDISRVYLRELSWRELRGELGWRRGRGRWRF